MEKATFQSKISAKERATIIKRAPSMKKRNMMNLILISGVGLPVTPMAAAYLDFFVPPNSGNNNGSLVAKDRLGNDIKSQSWLKSHKNGDKSLSQGLKGDPTYIIINDNSHIENYAIVSICTHLGCVVPFNVAENKFMCPCHGSQYNFQGKVVRGPAPLSLSLVHCDINENDDIVFSPWTETDFRTDLKPWWI